MVLQKNELFSGTIKENLRWGNPNATDEELVHACRLACADEFIRSFPRRLRHPHRAGRHQRLRRSEAASLHRPGAAEKAQDPHSGRLHLRRGYPHRRHDPPGLPGEIPGTTKLIIAQRIASVQDADIIVVLDNGMVKDVGTHESLAGLVENLSGSLLLPSRKEGRIMPPCQNARRRPQSQEPQEDLAAAAGLHEALSSHSGCGAAVHHCQRRRPDHRQPLPSAHWWTAISCLWCGMALRIFLPCGDISASLPASLRWA